MKRPMTSAELEREIGALADLPRPTLVERWRTHYRTDPPKGISRPLLVRAIAYEMQAKRYGGLKPATDRRLRMIANGTANGDHGGRQTAPTLQSGARLVREWNGANHVVEVVEHDVAQQRRERASLRSPLFHRTDQTVFHHPGVEVCPDELEHAFVGLPRGDPRHQAVMIDSVEEFLQIDVNHEAVALGDVALRLGYCSLSTIARAITGARWSGPRFFGLTSGDAS